MTVLGEVHDADLHFCRRPVHMACLENPTVGIGFMDLELAFEDSTDIGTGRREEPCSIAAVGDADLRPRHALTCGIDDPAGHAQQLPELTVYVLPGGVDIPSLSRGIPFLECTKAQIDILNRISGLNFYFPQ